MKSILFSVLALGAMSTIALAAGPTTPTDAPSAPVRLTADQMDNVTAGVSPWLQTRNPGDQPNGCGGGNPNCTTVKNNPSANN